MLMMVAGMRVLLKGDEFSVGPKSDDFNRRCIIISE